MKEISKSHSHTHILFGKAFCAVETNIHPHVGMAYYKAFFSLRRTALQANENGQNAYRGKKRKTITGCPGGGKNASCTLFPILLPDATIQ